MDPHRARRASPGLTSAGGYARRVEGSSPALPIAPALALVVRGLGRTYDGTRALAELSFDVRAGEIVGLVGPNGAGKTTALRSIAGILPIQEGRVAVCGHDVAREEVA